MGSIGIGSNILDNLNLCSSDTLSEKVTTKLVDTMTDTLTNTQKDTLTNSQKDGNTH